MLERKGHSITRVQCDNSRENLAEVLLQFYNRRGITLKTANPYESNQNAKAERRRRLVMERTRALLMEMEVPKIYWAFAAMTAAYMLNITPRSNGKSPHEMLDGEERDKTKHDG